MASAADRTPANMDILADTALNAAPVFPFHVCHKNGYFLLNPPVEFDPAPLATEIVFTAPEDWTEDNGSGCNAIFGAMEPEALLLTPCGLIDFAGNYANLSGATAFPASGGAYQYYQGHRYKLTISMPDSQHLTLAISGAEGNSDDLIRAATPFNYELVTPLLVNPVIYFGFPTKAQLACNYQNDETPKCRTAEGMIIHSVSRVA